MLTLKSPLLGQERGRLPESGSGGQLGLPEAGGAECGQLVTKRGLQSPTSPIAPSLLSSPAERAGAAFTVIKMKPKMHFPLSSTFWHLLQPQGAPRTSTAPRQRVATPPQGQGTVWEGPASGSSRLTAGSRFLGRLKPLWKQPFPGPSSHKDAVAGRCGARLGGSHLTALNDLLLGSHVPESGIRTWGRQEGNSWAWVLLAPCASRDRQMLSG